MRVTKKMLEAESVVDSFMKKNMGRPPTYDKVNEMLGLKGSASYNRLRRYRDKMVRFKSN